MMQRFRMSGRALGAVTPIVQASRSQQGVPAVRTFFTSTVSKAAPQAPRVAPTDKAFAAFTDYNEIELPTDKRVQTMLSGPATRDDQEWVVVEKIHGTNFGVYLLDEKEVRFAKRTGILPLHENFFGYHAIKDQLEQQVKLICGKLKKRYDVPKIGKVIINGELFGARYDHPQVPRSNKTFYIGKAYETIYEVKKCEVQAEPFPQYSPEIQFYAFDLKLSPSGDDKDIIQIGFNEFAEICDSVPDLVWSKPLRRGTFKHCLTFDVENFETPIPAALGLGNFPIEGNLAEGVIIRHVLHDTPQSKRMFPNGAHGKNHTMLKVRNSAFMEMKHPKIQEGLRQDLVYKLQEKSSTVNGSTVIPDSYLPEISKLAMAQLSNNISMSRCNNCVSKVGIDPLQDGTFTQDDFCKMLAKDALKDFLKTSEDIVLNMELAFRKHLVRQCYAECRIFVQEHWPEITRAAG